MTNWKEKKLRVAGLGLLNGKEITLDENEMDYWDIHALPMNLIIIVDLRKFRVQTEGER